MMNWYLPDCDPFTLYFIQELTRWIGNNGVTLLVLTNLLMALKVLAQRTKSVTDDKIISFLLYIVSFKWLSDMTKKKEEADG